MSTNNNNNNNNFDDNNDNFDDNNDNFENDNSSSCEMDQHRTICKRTPSIMEWLGKLDENRNKKSYKKMMIKENERKKIIAQKRGYYFFTMISSDVFNLISKYVDKTYTLNIMRLVCTKWNQYIMECRINIEKISFHILTCKQLEQILDEESSKMLKGTNENIALHTMRLDIINPNHLETVYNKLTKISSDFRMETKPYQVSYVKRISEDDQKCKQSNNTNNTNNTNNNNNTNNDDDYDSINSCDCSVDCDGMNVCDKSIMMIGFDAYKMYGGLFEMCRSLCNIKIGVEEFPLGPCKYNIVCDPFWTALITQESHTNTDFFEYGDVEGERCSMSDNHHLSNSWRIVPTTLSTTYTYLGLFKEHIGAYVNNVSLALNVENSSPNECFASRDFENFNLIIANPYSLLICLSSKDGGCSVIENASIICRNANTAYHTQTKPLMDVSISNPVHVAEIPNPVYIMSCFLTNYGPMIIEKYSPMENSLFYKRIQFNSLCGEQLTNSINIDLVDYLPNGFFKDVVIQEINNQIRINDESAVGQILFPIVPELKFKNHFVYDYDDEVPKPTDFDNYDEFEQEYTNFIDSLEMESIPIVDLKYYLSKTIIPYAKLNLSSYQSNHKLISSIYNTTNEDDKSNNQSSSN